MARGEVPDLDLADFSLANDLNDLETEIICLLTSNWSVSTLNQTLKLIDELIATAPTTDPVMDLANTIIDACNEYDVQTVLTVLSNVVGQVIVGLAGTTPASVITHVGNFAAAVQVAATNKIIHDTNTKDKK